MTLTTFTPEKEQKFLDSLGRTGNVSAAARKIAATRQTAYNHRANSKPFAEAWDEAIATYIDKLEAEADRRAVTGTLKPVFYRGDECGQVREYSDTLLMFRLKGLAPEKYRERHEHSGPGGGAIPFSVEGSILKVFGDDNSDRATE